MSSVNELPQFSKHCKKNLRVGLLIRINFVGAASETSPPLIATATLSMSVDVFNIATNGAVYVHTFKASPRTNASVSFCGIVSGNSFSTPLYWFVMNHFKISLSAAEIDELAEHSVVKISLKSASLPNVITLSLVSSFNFGRPTLSYDGRITKFAPDASVTHAEK